MEDIPTVPGGTIAGRYTIERELGRGGAAIVFLARDMRQERQVALKVLHRELGQAIGAQRFLREIKHSSALHHPHLLSIHESGESDGLLYYVMPFMSDGSLRTRIAKEKQLAVDESLRITRQVGEALSYAHSQGIVHRDIKPDNVLFSADHACLADFGIARAVDSVAADTLTSTGLVVGTPAYMSPEQASGEREVDARSDQYSLACLLYEMITGLPPFIGATMQSVISQRFTQPPPSMRAHRPSVPDNVERAVKRAMATTPADRFPSVADFVAALYDPTAVIEAVSVHSIRRRWFAVGAVAAFAAIVVMAAGPGSDWVRGAWGTQVDTAKFVVLPFESEGDPVLGKRIATGLHSALREWEGLAVTGDAEVRDAVAKRGGEVASLRDAIDLARELGAGRLIWGTVSADGADTRVVAHVYDVTGSAELVEKTFEGPAVARDTAMRTLANELLALGSLPARFDGGLGGTRSIAALQAYRVGAAALAQFDLDRAQTAMVRATELDPDFGVAHLELARVQSWLQQNQSPTWHGSARRAVALGGELRPRDAIRANALLAYAQGNYAAACDRQRELIAVDTLDAQAWYGLAECLHADSVVVRDPRSRSGFSFRSSWHAAGNALVRALEIEPALHTVPHERRLAQVFPTARNKIRTGRGRGPDTLAFGAVPSLIGDTVGFTPYVMPNFEQENDAGARSRRSRALARNRQVMLGLTSSWIRAYPRSSYAHTAHASILEQRGDLNSAARSLATAKQLARNGLDSLLLSDAEARIRYKAGDFLAARGIAHSALTMFRETTESNWEPVARLAGLTGAVGRLTGALQFFWAKYADIKDLDQAVTRAAGESLAYAAMGICREDPLALERRLQSLVEIHVQPDRHREINDRVVGLILSYSTPCARGSQLGSIGGVDRLARAQRAFAAGHATLAAALLDSAARNRSHLRPGDVSPSVVAREAFLRLALGDTANALVLIEGTLSGLPAVPASTMLHPLEAATLVRMMVTRADLGGSAASTVSAGKWAQAVAVLWGESDPVARPIVSRMAAIGGAGLER